MLVTPKEYESLTDKEKYYLDPVWKEYKTKKVRDYSDCMECGHREFLGWIEEQVPVGEPYGYKKITPFFPYDLMKQITATHTDQVLNSNIIMQRTLNAKWSGSEVRIPNPNAK